MDQQLTQSDFDDLSAYMDGELTGEAKLRVERLLKEDPRWARELRQLRELDGCLNAYAVPAAPEGLAARIIANVPSQAASSPVWKLIRWMIPVAAAAAVVIATGSYFWRPAPQPQPEGGGGAAKVDDQFMVENLSFFSDYDVVRDLETIEAIEQIQDETVGT